MKYQESITMKGTDKRLVLAVSNSVCHWWASPDLRSPNYYLYSGLFHEVLTLHGNGIS